MLSEIDSTNTYALEAVHAGKMYHGEVVQAMQQSAGRGQRQNTWQSSAGKDLLMSLVLQPLAYTAESIFLLNMCVSLAIRKVVAAYCDEAHIKWSNDIYHQHKKIAGILIENVWRGESWLYAVVGIGLNIFSHHQHNTQINACSMAECSKLELGLEPIREAMLTELNKYLEICAQEPNAIVTAYNSHLYQVNCTAKFATANGYDMYTIKGVDKRGEIMLERDGVCAAFAYGEVKQVVVSA